LRGAFDQAAPTVGIRSADLAGRRAQLAVLLVPSGAGGDRFRGLVERALPEAELVLGTSPDDVVLYRELPRMALAELLEGAQTGSESYRQLAGLDPFPPHSRTDIPFVTSR